jgi:serine protease Do
MGRLPDWVIYLMVLAALVWLLAQIGERADAPPAPSPIESVDDEPGPPLPAASIYDPEVLVEVGPVTSGIGTAFAIDKRGWWLTARHVVDDCKEVGVVVGPRRAIRAKEVRTARFADLALIRTDQAPGAIRFDLAEEKFRIGQSAFHVGYPQGRPGEAASRLIGRERLIARGRYNLEEPVLAWAELGRTEGMGGSLAGMSGGPVLDAQGEVIGVTVAESARRGRIYTATPTSILQLFDLNNVDPKGEPVGNLDIRNYDDAADKLRFDLSVAQIVCVAR